MESKINVMVRMKPMSPTDVGKEKNHIWSKVSENTLMNKRTKELFSYDRVFDADVSTHTIFNE